MQLFDSKQSQIITHMAMLIVTEPFLLMLSQSGDRACNVNFVESPVLNSIDSLVNVGKDVGKPVFAGLQGA